MSVALGPGERRDLVVSGMFAVSLPRGRFVAVEVLQSLDDGRGEGRQVGGIGIFVSG